MQRKVLDEILLVYFYSWRPYSVIIARLKEVHGLERSIIWLKKQFKQLALSRRPKEYTPDTIVINCIRKELRGANCSIGYRAMWMIMREKYHLICKRKTVMMLLNRLNPKGVRSRRRGRLTRRRYISKGPNYVWHLDGYDKLTQFGFPIHGCIDGFSRKLMWLKIGSSNSDPSVVLHYFLDAVNEVNGCPSVVRMDCGTENVKVAAVQYAFRANHTDSHAGSKSFLYGTSPANVRIESLWSQLRRGMTGWWIKVLKELRQQRVFCCADRIHRQCLAVVFGSIIEKELEAFRAYWNNHCLRKSHKDCLGGIPNDLHEMPQFYRTVDCLQTVDWTVWGTAMAQEAHLSPPMFSTQFYELCALLVRHKFGIDLHKDININNCVEVYLYLTVMI